MANRRRKRKESFLDALLQAPWQVSITLGVAVFVGLKWILPSIGASNILLKPMTQAFSGLAWLFSGFFFLVGGAVYAKGAFSKTKQPSPALREPGMSSNPARTEADSHGWPDSTKASAGSSGPLSENTEKPAAWSIDLIRNLEWKRFEDVCQKFYELKGIRSETTALGPDGGIDIRLYQDDSGQATSVVQCKAWGERFVGVKPVRELLGVIVHEKIGKAFFMTSGRFSDEAKEFAKSNRITLIDGGMLLMMIIRLPEAAQQSLLAFATEGDYRTPTCPSCGIKMKHVTGKAGRPNFWGCTSYPRCRQMLGMRREA